MREISNLGRPDTPFGATQRPYGRPTLLLAGVSVLWSRAPHAVPAAAAVTYLRVHRTRTLPVTSDTLKIGFHAAAPHSHADVLSLVALFDRLLFQAGRHATVLAGHQFLDDLTSLQTAARGMPSRGISALLPAWNRADPKPGVAGYTDTATSADGTARTLDEACAAHRVLVAGLPEGLHARDTLRQRHQAASAWRNPHVTDRILAAAVARSLAVALVAAEMGGRYRWDDPLDLATLLFREAWDHLPTLTSPAPPRDPPVPARACR